MDTARRLGGPGELGCHAQTDERATTDHCRCCEAAEEAVFASSHQLDQVFASSLDGESSVSDCPTSEESRVRADRPVLLFRAVGGGWLAVARPDKSPTNKWGH